MTHQVSIKDLKIEIGNILLPDGLEIEKVTFNAGPLVFNYEGLDLQLKEPASFQAFISFGALTCFLKKQGTDPLKDLSLGERGGKLFIKGKVQKILSFPVELLGNIKVTEKSLRLELEEARFLYFPVGQFTKGFVERINPVFTVEEFPVPVQLKSCTIQKEGVLVKGELTGVLPKEGKTKA